MLENIQLRCHQNQGHDYWDKVTVQNLTMKRTHWRWDDLLLGLSLCLCPLLVLELCLRVMFVHWYCQEKKTGLFFFYKPSAIVSDNQDDIDIMFC